MFSREILKPWQVEHNTWRWKTWTAYFIKYLILFYYFTRQCFHLRTHPDMARTFFCPVCLFININLYETLATLFSSFQYYVPLCLTDTLHPLKVTNVNHTFLRISQNALGSCRLMLPYYDSDPHYWLAWETAEWSLLLMREAMTQCSRKHYEFLWYLRYLH